MRTAVRVGLAREYAPTAADGQVAPRMNAASGEEVRDRRGGPVGVRHALERVQPPRLMIQARDGRGVLAARKVAPPFAMGSARAVLLLVLA